MLVHWHWPIEAYAKGGRVVPATWRYRDDAGDERDVRFVECSEFGWPFKDDGTPVHRSSWRVRNRARHLADGHAE